MRDHAHTLEVVAGERLLFGSTGGWLRPLFELEQWLRRSGVALSDCVVEDKAVGRAAALLLARLEARRLVAQVLSERAVPVLEGAGIAYEAGLVVPKLGCATEEALADCTDYEQAYREICRRLDAGRLR